eukprot:scaffold7007_cov146-Amphora_coffeaeformis.AAC.3
MALITSLDPGARAWTEKVSCISVVDCPVAVVITKYLRLYPVGTLLLAGGIQAWVILYGLRIRGKMRVPFIIPIYHKETTYTLPY